VAVTLQDVQHIASLARIGLAPGHAATLAAELNTILGHMDVLGKVDTEGVQPSTGVGAGGLRKRSDSSGSVPLARALDAFAPSLRERLLLVPRLSTHESTEES
jgi:aspartyl-tRNA(Asn)/glutamyl-tRNA(Gln) amidotransferase subunit C